MNHFLPSDKRKDLKNEGKKRDESFPTRRQAKGPEKSTARKEMNHFIPFDKLRDLKKKEQSFFHFNRIR